jgi:hypothetical protein
VSTRDQGGSGSGSCVIIAPLFCFRVSCFAACCLLVDADARRGGHSTDTERSGGGRILKSQSAPCTSETDAIYQRSYYCRSVLASPSPTHRLLLLLYCMYGRSKWSKCFYRAPEVLLLRAGGRPGGACLVGWTIAVLLAQTRQYIRVNPQLGIAGAAGAYALLCDLMENETRMDLEEAGRAITGPCRVCHHT